MAKLLKVVKTFADDFEAEAWINNPSYSQYLSDSYDGSFQIPVNPSGVTEIDLTVTSATFVGNLTAYTGSHSNPNPAFPTLDAGSYRITVFTKPNGVADVTIDDNQGTNVYTGTYGYDYDDIQYLYFFSNQSPEIQYWMLANADNVDYIGMVNEQSSLFHLWID